MPFYDYYCLYCDHVVELFHSMTENRNNEPCPTCQETQALRRLVANEFSLYHESNAGSLVKDFIQENKELNKQEKEKLSKQEYKK